MKIVHSDPIKEEVITELESSQQNKDLFGLQDNVKFNLLDPLKVLTLFRNISHEVIFLCTEKLSIKYKDVPILMVGLDDAKHPINLLLQRNTLLKYSHTLLKLILSF